MKKMFQNMLLRDFIGATLCLMMTFVLLMMVSGCSEDSKSVGSLGGAEEETGVYALAGRMGDVQPKLLRVAGEQDSLPEYENFVTVEKGSVVTVYELDSLTLDTTGRFLTDTIDNDSGRFVFEEIGLNGPYVLIVEENGPPIIADERGRMTFKYMTYSAIVNVQNLTNVSVNALTSAKVPFLREYVAQGKSFAEANKMAERDVLKQLGIYEDLGPFEELFRFFWAWKRREIGRFPGDEIARHRTRGKRARRPAWELRARWPATPTWWRGSPPPDAGRSCRLGFTPIPSGRFPRRRRWSRPTRRCRSRRPCHRAPRQFPPRRFRCALAPRPPT